MALPVFCLPTLQPDVGVSTECGVQPHRLQLTDTVTLLHLEELRRHTVSLCLYARGMGTGFTSMQVSHALAVPKWVTSACPDAEKISLGADRPAPGTRAEFSKSKGTAMSCHQVPLVTHSMASLQDTLSALLESQKEHIAIDLFI